MIRFLEKAFPFIAAAAILGVYTCFAFSYENAKKEKEYQELSKYYDLVINTPDDKLSSQSLAVKYDIISKVIQRSEEKE